MSPPKVQNPESRKGTADESNREPALDAGDGGKPTVLATIRGLKDGSIHGRNLPPETRRQCVEHLLAEGCSVPDMAEILKVSERTIARDRRAIHEAHAIDPDPRLLPQMVGRLLSALETCTQRVRRAGREKEALPADRIQAEVATFKFITDAIMIMQRLGYLPTAAHRLEATLRRGDDDLPPLNALLDEVTRLEQLAELSPDETLPRKLAEIRQLTAHASLAVEVQEAAALAAPVVAIEESAHDAAA